MTHDETQEVVDTSTCAGLRNRRCEEERFVVMNGEDSKDFSASMEIGEEMEEEGCRRTEIWRCWSELSAGHEVKEMRKI